ncbi:hypothetical protein N7540_001944 [Penicillium herquei]|nr:hypothetical protein N7540_001944 [Penicillium herquei]
MLRTVDAVNGSDIERNLGLLVLYFGLRGVAAAAGAVPSPVDTSLESFHNDARSSQSGPSWVYEKAKLLCHVWFCTSV